MGFEPGYGRPTCLATLKSSDRTVCLWMTSYIYIKLIFGHAISNMKTHMTGREVDILFSCITRTVNIWTEKTEK